MEYKKLTTTEIAPVVSFSISYNCEKARRLFFEQFNKEPPPARTLRDWKSRFMETLSVLPRSHAGDKTNCRLSDEKKNEVILAFENDPCVSQRQVSRQCGISLGSVNNILKEEGLRPWKFTSVQELQTDDKPKRVEFCRTILERQQLDPDFVRSICFSDEATFHVNGSVTRHNSFVYSYENPHALSVQPMRSPSIMCWSMVSPKLGIIFHIAETTMNGERYKDILTTKVVPHLNQRRNQNLLYQQDGAPAHYAVIVRELLNKELNGRWIGRGGHIEWPPRSPDLSVNDFWLWGDIRNRLYSSPRPCNLIDLRSHLEHLLQSISIETIDRAYESFIRRCSMCVAAEGGHFEQLL